MVARVARKSAPNRRAGFELDSLVRAGLDTLDFGFAIFDRGLALVACNKAFRTLRGYPAALCRSGTALVEFYRFNAKRGDYGPGDAEAHAQVRLARVRTRKAHDLEYTLASGRILGVRYRPIVDGGLVLAYADITARKRAEQQAERREAELKVALDNMPGALAYTDEQLNIVVCNDRFADMYPVPRSFLRRGRPYPAFLRYLAEHSYHGEGDVDTLVAARVDSLRNPTGKTFEDRTPDGRVYEVYRRRAAAGGTVKRFPRPVRTHRVVGLYADDGVQGRVIRQEQDGFLLVIDQRKLTGKRRAGTFLGSG